MIHGEIVPEIIKKYNLEGQDLVEQDIDKIKGIKFIQRNLAKVSDKLIRHDPNLVASSIIELICDDLKYQDKQNDPQFMMLNNKLLEDKRINKIKKNMVKKENKNKNGKIDKNKKSKSKSKFSSKYSDRIASIKEADAKTKKLLEKERMKKTRKRPIVEEEVSKTRRKKVATNTNQRTETKRKTPEEIREEMMKMYKNGGK